MLTMMKTNKAIEKQILHVFKIYGLNVQARNYQRYIRNQLKRGQRIWNTTIKELLGENLFSFCSDKIEEKGKYYYIENIPRVSAFGYTLGLQPHLIFNGNEETAEHFAIINSLFNTCASLFDKICDGFIDLYPKLINWVTPKSLLDAMQVKNENGGSHFTLKENDEPALIVILKIMEEYFKRCREIYRISKNKTVWEEFKKTILVLYKSELLSRNLRFTTRYEQRDIYYILRNKSSLTVWQYFLPTLLSDDLEQKYNYQILKNDMLKLGDIFWIMDDIVDSVEDLESNKWSYTWFKLNYEYGVKIVDENNNVREKQDLLDKLIKSGAIVDAANDLCVNYIEAKDAIKKISKDYNNLEITVLPWLQNWLNSL